MGDDIELDALQCGGMGMVSNQSLFAENAARFKKCDSGDYRDGNYYLKLTYWDADTKMADGGEWNSYYLQYFTAGRNGNKFLAKWVNVGFKNDKKSRNYFAIYEEKTSYDCVEFTMNDKKVHWYWYRWNEHRHDHYYVKVHKSTSKMEPKYAKMCLTFHSA